MRAGTQFTLGVTVFWGLYFLPITIWTKSGMDLQITITCVCVLAAAFIFWKSYQFGKFKQRISSGELLYFEVTDRTMKMWQNILIPPVSLIIVYFLLRAEQDGPLLDPGVFLLVLPTVPFGLFWLADILLNSYSTGLVISNNYLQQGSSGSTVKWEKVNSIRVKNGVLHIQHDKRWKFKLQEYDKMQVQAILREHGLRDKDEADTVK